MAICISKPDAISDTVITSFPQGWDRPGTTEDGLKGVLESLENDLKNPHRPALKSVYGLASLIIYNCSSVFDRFRAPRNHQYLDVFDNSICDIVIPSSYSSLEMLTVFESNKELALSSKYQDLTRELGNCHDANKLEELFNITNEVFLLSAIRDIRDELNILDHILDDQHNALRELLGKKKGSRGTSTQLKNSMYEASVLGPVEINRKAVRKMQRDAKKVYNDVSTMSKTKSCLTYRLQVSRLLDLKQKYANAWEARFSRVEAESSTKQGKVGDHGALTFC
jgi:hypothetical protein